MKTSDIVYCSLLGLCNFVILREVMTYGLSRTIFQAFANPRLKRAVFWGLLATVGGGIAHRVADFNPDFQSPFNWLLVFIFPLILAYLCKGALDPGWTSLEQGKALWKSLYPDLTYRDGVVQASASQLARHPKIIEAKRLITAAIEFSPQSNIDRPSALANKAIAWQELGLLHRVVHEFEEAEKAFNTSLHLLDEVEGLRSNNRSILSAYRDTAFRIGELHQVRGNPTEARKWYQASLSIDDRLGHDEPYGEQTTRTLLRQLDESRNV